MGASLCKVNCCNIRLQRALPLIEMDCLPEFCPILPEFLLLSTTFNTTLIILQPSGGTLPFGPLKNRSVELMSNTLISNRAGLLVGLATIHERARGEESLVWIMGQNADKILQPVEPHHELCVCHPPAPREVHHHHQGLTRLVPTRLLPAIYRLELCW